VSKPVPYEFEPLWLKSVNARPASLLVNEQARRLQDLEVPRGRLPSMFENCRDVTSSHGAPIEINREQHASSGGVR